jgi:hypothetical protein
VSTILDTLGIATCAISYGKESSFAGQLASVSIKVVPKALGVVYLRLNWAATGDMFSSFSDSTSAGQGSPGIIVLPQTGQSGFRHGTTAFKDWYYEAVVTADLGDGQELSRTYRFSIPAGQMTLDLDTLDEDGIVTAMPTTAPFVSEPVGLSDATRAALSATYLPLWKASTPYTVGQDLLNPSGSVVQVATAHTSTSTYDSSKFTVLSGSSLAIGAY